ncbi:hypothetical protein niasHT_027724 [Heterodera trifolii]|uniref:Uncharacterized protein n=1 Tax=Heterodera trifolii TaxID=157864 RepID=A0ABD2KBE6_9BILA
MGVARNPPKMMLRENRKKGRCAKTEKRITINNDSAFTYQLLPYMFWNEQLLCLLQFKLGVPAQEIIAYNMARGDKLDRIKPSEIAFTIISLRNKGLNTRTPILKFNESLVDQSTKDEVSKMVDETQCELVKRMSEFDVQQASHKIVKMAIEKRHVFEADVAPLIWPIGHRRVSARPLLRQGQNVVGAGREHVVAGRSAGLGWPGRGTAADVRGGRHRLVKGTKAEEEASAKRRKRRRKECRRTLIRDCTNNFGFIFRWSQISNIAFTDLHTRGIKVF